MKILITTKRFPPEVPATAVLCEELAQELVRQGFQVTVAAGYPHHPYGRIFPGFRKRFCSIEERQGMRLIRGWHFIHPSSSTLIRAIVMVSQCLSYLISARHGHGLDLVISFDGYPLVGPLISSLIARRFRAKSISVIYDLYPDVAIEQGIIKGRQFVYLARKLENLSYHWSDRIVVLSEGFRRVLINERGVKSEKVSVIPVWLDTRSILPMDRDNPWRQEMKIPQTKFVVLYAGTIGLVSGAQIIADVAQYLASYKDILFLMVGDGYAKEEVQAKARDLRLTNIRFLPFQPRERLSELQATADISLVTLSPGRGRTSVPSKVLGYMAAARPIIAAVDIDCDTADMVKKARCGTVVPPGDPGSLAQALLNYYSHPLNARLDGERGRNYFLENFEKNVVIKNYLKLIQGLYKNSDH